MKLQALASVLLVLGLASLVQAGDCGCGGGSSCTGNCGSTCHRSYGRCMNPCCGRLFPTIPELLRGFGALLPCGGCGCGGCGGCGGCRLTCCAPRPKTCPGCKSCSTPLLPCASRGCGCGGRPKIGCTSGCGCGGHASHSVDFDNDLVLPSATPEHHTLPPGKMSPTPAPKMMEEPMPGMPMGPAKIKIDPFQDDVMTNRLPATRPIKTHKITPTINRSAAMEPAKEVVKMAAHLEEVKAPREMPSNVDLFAETETKPAAFVQRTVPVSAKQNVERAPSNPLRR